MVNAQDIRVHSPRVLGSNSLVSPGTATVSTGGVDMGGLSSGNFAYFLVRFGTNAASANLSSITVDLSDNGSTWVSGPNLLSAVLATTALSDRAINIAADGRNARFVRLTFTTTATATATTVISYVEGFRVGNQQVPPPVLGTDLALV